VLTDAGRVRTGTVICAAGAWSRTVGDWVGAGLPVTPLRRQIAVTAPVPNLPPRLPMTIDLSTTFYFHAEGPGLLIGMSDPDEQPGFDLRASDAWLPRLTAAAEKRAPQVLDHPVATTWAGLYEMTPDANALIGEAGDVNRFLYATGFSGHGFLMGPAVGEVLRDLYLGTPPPVDVTALSAERFGAGAALTEVAIV
jgi:sarcosine oxidase, subunit beta